MDTVSHHSAAGGLVSKVADARTDDVAEWAPFGAVGVAFETHAEERAAVTRLAGHIDDCIEREIREIRGEQRHAALEKPSKRLVASPAGDST